MIDPNWQSDHPRLGAAGTQRIYKFANGLGAQVLRDYTNSTLTLYYIASFNEPEINNFNLAATPAKVLADESALQVELSNIRDTVPQ